VKKNGAHGKLSIGMSWQKRNTIIVLLFVALGVLVDFLFNGIIIGYFFKMVFKEQWVFIYAPLYFALAMGLSNFLLKSQRFHEFHWAAIFAFLCGTALGHLTFVDIHRTQTYQMDLDLAFNDQYGTILLRSNDWPQILLVTSASARDELTKHYTQSQKVPVELDVITDYGCNRSNAISTVAGVDVMSDNSATWAWQKDNEMSLQNLAKGPGQEDQHLFWCVRPPRPKWMDDSPWRPWDRHRETSTALGS